MGEHPVATDRQHRIEPRLKLPAMYTLVRVRLAGEQHYRWTGHIYDISLSGMRFEIDDEFEPGTEIEVRCMLPGHRHTLFRATGRVVRVHDDDPIVAPVRMSMAFSAFENSIDHYRLAGYLESTGLERRPLTSHRRAA